MVIITISGKAEAGKDTFAEALRDCLVSYERDVRIVKHGDTIKHVARMLYGWDGKKDEAGRTLLQETGAKGRKKYPNFWAKFTADILSACAEDLDFVLIPDTRYPDEVDIFSSMGGTTVYTLNVVRPEHENSLTEKQRNHSSETAMDDFDFDVVVINDSAVERLKTGPALALAKALAKEVKERPSTEILKKRLYNRD